MPLADFEWLAALAYPVGILISVLLAKKTATAAPATATEPKQQILENASILHPNIQRTCGATLAIVLLSTPAAQEPLWSRTKARTLRAALTLTLSGGEDDENGEVELPSRTSTKIIAQGAPSGSLSEGLESLLAVLAKGMEEHLVDPERGRARKRD